MGKLRDSKKLKLVAVTSLAIFTLFSAMTASFAWFTGMKAQKNDQSEVIVQDPTLIDHVVMRPFYTSQSPLPADTLAFDIDDGHITTQLGYFSPLTGGYQTVLEVFLTDYAAGLSNLVLSGHTTAEHYLGELNPDTGRPYQLLAASGNSLTSVMNFTFFTEADWTGSDVITYKYFTVSKSALKSREVSFVTSSMTLNESIVIQDIDMDDVNIPVTNKHFFILLDYDEIQINEIFAANLGNPVCSGEAGAYLHYTPDFTFNLREGSAS